MQLEDGTLTQALGDIRQKIEELHIPTAAYAALGISHNEYFISIVDGEQAVNVKGTLKGDQGFEQVITWLTKYTHSHNVKIIAAAVMGGPEVAELGSKLWLEEDIVPYLYEHSEELHEAKVHDMARHIAIRFDANHIVQVPLHQANEVGVAYLVTQEAYKKTVKAKTWKYLLKQVEEFKNLKNDLLFINATPQGGGVALMRHALIRLYRLLGLGDMVHWHVLIPNKDVFDITKTKFHNVLQAVQPKGVELNDHDKNLFMTWSEENAELFRDVIQKAKVIVIDDPQPSGLVPHILKINPHVKLMYRSHIQLDRDLIADTSTPQSRTWQFIWDNAKAAHTFISHPMDQFVPYDVVDKTVNMPACTDPLDGLNKPLNKEQMNYYLSLFNKILLEHDQTPLDRKRPYIIQIARFDPSKGIPDVIEAYRLLREKMQGDPHAPQLVLVGHGSIDDPDGIPIYNMVIHMLQSDKYRHLASDVKVVRLHHNDQILNALLRDSKIAMQLSHKEGFEVKVSESLHKGKPVVAYRTGGIPLQIEDGITGFLVSVGDIDAVTERLYRLFMDETLYTTMSKAAAKRVKPDYFTVHNAIKWLFLANQLLQHGKLPGDRKPVKELMGSELE